MRFPRVFSAASPARLFAALSLLFGLAVVALTPPLRAPDETAHFVRAYGMARGEIIPRLADDKGRKGLRLPARIAADLDFFNAIRQVPGGRGSFFTVFAEHAATREARLAAAGTTDRFWLFEGSEGYSPAAYLPAVAAAALAQLAGLDFLPTLYLMRAASLVAYTAVIGFALTRLPGLHWAVFLIALLPSSLYGRAVISADGAALASALAVFALALQGAAGAANGAARRSVWMLWCALTKPSQLALVLLEAMVRPWRSLPQHWRATALVVLPAIAVSALWIVLVDADMAAWRLTGDGSPPSQEFNPAWKLRYLLAHPLQFPSAVRVSLDYTPELWRQLIGVLGWLDTRLQPWIYPILGLMLLGTFLTHLPFAFATRLRVAAVAALTALGYAVAVFLIFYLTSTPTDSPRVEGIQGRYFVAAAPLAAAAVAALLPRGLPASLLAITAVAGALLSGVATLEAILRTDWLRP